MFNFQNKIIVVDLCNTIADIVSELDIRLGRNLNPEQYFHPSLKDQPHYFEKNLDIFLNAKPIQDSVNMLNELSIHNEIIYMTARPKIAEFVTKLWLKKNGYPKGNVYFSENKAKLASELGVNIAIEDAPFEIDKYIKTGIEVLVKQQAYNEGYNNRFDWNNEKENGIMLKRQG